MFGKIKEALEKAIYEQPPEEKSSPQPRPVRTDTGLGSLPRIPPRMAAPASQFSDDMTRPEVDKIYYAGIAATETPAAAKFIKMMTALATQETNGPKRAAMVLTMMGVDGVTADQVRADFERVFGAIGTTTQALRNYIAKRLEEINQQQSERDSAARQALAEKKDLLAKLQAEIRQLDENLQNSQRDSKAAAEKVHGLMEIISAENIETNQEIHQMADLLGPNDKKGGGANAR